MSEDKQQNVIDRGLDSKKFIEAPIYQKVLNGLIDECIGAWASTKIEEKEKRVEYVFNGEQAVKLVAKSIEEEQPFRYSLILMNCNMPIMDGY